MSFSYFDESESELCQSCWFFRKGRSGYQYNYTESSSYYDDLVYDNPFYDNLINYVDICPPIPVPHLYPVQVPAQVPAQVPTCILPALPPPAHIIDNIARNTIICPSRGNPGGLKGINRGIGGRGGIPIPTLPGISSLPIRPTGIRGPIRGSRSFIPTRPGTIYV